MEFLFFITLALTLFGISRLFPSTNNNANEKRKDRFRRDNSVVNDSNLGSYID